MPAGGSTPPAPYATTYPKPRPALADGAITVEHVRAIRGAHRTIGDALSTCEDTVVAFARDHSAKDLRGFLDVLIQNYRPDDHDRDAEAARTRRHARLSSSLDGWWHLTGFLDPATGAALAAALDVYATTTGPDDDRTAGNRTADALAEIAHRALDTVDRPSGLGHVTLTLTPDQLATGLRRALAHRAAGIAHRRAHHHLLRQGHLRRGDPHRPDPLGAVGRRIRATLRHQSPTRRPGRT